MPEVSSINVTALMDDALHAAERAHQLMVGLADIAGFYRARVNSVGVGDELGFGANEWKLVIATEDSVTPEGYGVTRVVFADDTDHVFDPSDIVDVKAVPDVEPF